MAQGQVQGHLPRQQQHLGGDQRGRQSARPRCHPRPPHYNSSSLRTRGPARPHWVPRNWARSAPCRSPWPSEGVPGLRCCCCGGPLSSTPPRFHLPKDRSCFSAGCRSALKREGGDACTPPRGGCGRPMLNEEGLWGVAVHAASAEGDAPRSEPGTGGGGRGRQSPLRREGPGQHLGRARSVGRSPNKRCKGGRRKEDPAQGTCWRRGRVRPWRALRLTAAQLES